MLSRKNGLLLSGLTFASVLTVSCGSGGSASPTSPTPTNSSPVIASMSVSPSSGVSSLSTFALAASATDANSDALTYTWTVGSSTLTGSNLSSTITGDGAVTVRLTVTDGKGGSVTDTRAVTIGTLTGTWDVVGIICDSRPFNVTLTQSGGTASGSFLFPLAWCNASAGLTGVTDPAEPATITAAGKVDIRLKAGAFVDFYLRGNMSADGRTVTGGMFNSGFTGQPFSMTKR